MAVLEHPPELKPHITWRPNSRVQHEFLAAREYEALYGGAKGGGKSRALVAGALRFVQKESYKAIIFRRTYPQLRELTDFAAKIYPLHGGKGKSNNTEWKFPSGAQILFGHMQHEKDADNYNGIQYQFIGFDQLEQFTKHQYETMRSCCRSEDPTIPCFIRATSNPGGVGHAWVKEFFIDTCRPVNLGPAIHDKMFDVLWQPQKAGKPYVTPDGIKRRFYPAKVFDNPDLLLANPHYVKILKELPANMRKAYLDGNYDIFDGQYFAEWNEALHVRPPWIPQEGTDEWGIPLTWPRFGGIDYGSANPWAALECATDPSNGRVIVYRAIAAKAWTHAMQAEWLLNGSPNAVYVADDACFVRGNEKDAKVKQVSDAELWGQHGFHRVGPASKGRRVPGWAHLRQFLRPYDDTCALIEFHDTAGARGRYGIITTMPKMVHSEHDPEDMETDCPDEARDDAPDCLRYALLSRPVPAKIEKTKKRPFAKGDYGAAKEDEEDEKYEEQEHSGGPAVGNY